MNSPLCPNCREPMSSVEQGMGGVWSCIYCEGTWLSKKQVEELARRFPSGASGATDIPEVTRSASLACPDCSSATFEARQRKGIHRCTACNSLFFQKGVLAQALPEVFSGDREAPAMAALAGIIGATLALDSLPLAAALATKRKPPSGLNPGGTQSHDANFS